MTTKLKMGMHNRITAERFHLIKAALADGMSEAAVMARYDIKRTTMRYIQKSVNYYEYRLYTETLPAARKMPKVIAPSSGLAFEDFSYRRHKKPKPPVAQPTWQDEINAKSTSIVVITGIAILGIVALGVLAILGK